MSRFVTQSEFLARPSQQPSARPVLTEPGIIKGSQLADTSAGLQKLLEASALVSAKIAGDDRKRRAAHEQNNATVRLIEDSDKIMALDDMAPHQKSIAIGALIHDIASNDITDKDAINRFTVVAATRLSRINKQLEVERISVGADEADRYNKTLDADSSLEGAFEFIDSLGLPDAIAQRKKDDAKEILSKNKLQALRNLSASVENKQQILDIRDEAVANRGDLTTSEAARRVLLPAARTFAQSGDPTSVKLANDIVDALGASAGPEGKEIRELAKRSGAAYDGSSEVIDIFLGRSKGDMPRGEREHDKAVDRLLEFGMTIPQVAAKYAEHPSAPITSKFIERLSEADLDEAVLSLHVLQGRDLEGQQANDIANKIGGRVKAVFAGVRHISRDDIRYPSRIENSENESFDRGVSIARAKNLGRKFQGVDVAPLSMDDVSASLGVPAESITTDIYLRFQQLLEYATGESATRSDVNASPEQVLAVGMQRAASLMKTEGILPRAVQGVHPPGFLITGPDRFLSPKIQINSDESFEKYSDDIRSAAFKVVARMTAGQVGSSFGVPGMLTQFVKNNANPIDVRSDGPVLFAGKTYIPIMHNESVKGYMEWNEEGESPVVLNSDERFADIERARKLDFSTSSLSPTDQLRWRDGYPSKFVDVIDGSANGALRKKILRVAGQVYSARHGKNSAETDEEVARFNKIVDELLAELKWDGLVSPQKEINK